MSFHDDLIDMLPRLRRHAMSLARDRHAMEDLVQSTVLRALRAQASFAPGTNFAGWMHKILRNEFISGLRRVRHTVPLDELLAEPAVTMESHDDRLVVRELETALDRLPAEQREALLLATLSDMSHEQIASLMGCKLGTVKSRVCRARRQLQAELTGEEAPDARDAPIWNRPVAPERARRYPVALSSRCCGVLETTLP